MHQNWLLGVDSGGVKVKVTSLIDILPLKFALRYSGLISLNNLALFFGKPVFGY